MTGQGPGGYKWIYNKGSYAEPCRLCKENVVFRMSEPGDDVALLILNATLVRALGGCTLKGNRFCRYCSLRLTKLKEQFDEFDFARDAVERSVKELREKVCDKDLIPATTVTSIADSTVQDDKSMKMVTSSTSNYNVTEIEPTPFIPLADDSTNIAETTATIEAPSPDSPKTIEKIPEESPSIKLVSQPEGSTSNVAAPPEESSKNVTDATIIQPVEKVVENSISPDYVPPEVQTNIETVSSPILTTVTSQQVGKAVKVKVILPRILRPPKLNKSKYSSPSRTEEEDDETPSRPRKGIKRKVSFGRTETVLFIDNIDRKKIKYGEIKFNHRGNYDTVDCALTSDAEDEDEPEQEPQLEPEPEQPRPLKTYENCSRRRRFDLPVDPTTNPSVSQETNNITPEIDSQSVEAEAKKSSEASLTSKNTSTEVSTPNEPPKSVENKACASKIVKNKACPIKIVENEACPAKIAEIDTCPTISTENETCPAIGAENEASKSLDISPEFFDANYGSENASSEGNPPNEASISDSVEFEVINSVELISPPELPGSKQEKKNLPSRVRHSNKIGTLESVAVTPLRDNVVAFTPDLSFFNFL